ncbi:MAG: TrpR-like protein, YerC/YecD [Oscillospiraceae bacterium]|nr:TrpR-like protein, YerC/YecD [Oscillospiraceae bacterium]
MNNKLKETNAQGLFEAILTLETVEECFDFFEDLCTVPELKALSQRFLVAKMLDQSHVYSDIVKQTGASTATISRVNRSLAYGSDGYKIVFDRLKEQGKF